MGVACADCPEIRPHRGARMTARSLVLRPAEPGHQGEWCPRGDVCKPYLLTLENHGPSNSRESRPQRRSGNVLQDLGGLFGLPSHIRTTGALIGDTGENKEQIR